MPDPEAYPIPRLEKLPPADLSDPVIEVYKKDVDRTLLRENLKLTVAERLLKFQDYMEFIEGMRSAGARVESGRSRDAGR